MIRGGDERAVSAIVGAVLLLGILVTALALYQVNTVPAENERVEITHNAEVQDDLQGVRNSIVSVHGGGSGSSQSVTLGTNYPPRTFSINPPPASGTLQSEPLGDIFIENAHPVDGDDEIVSDWETGSTTYGITYSPRYSEYESAPDTLFEHGLLYNHYPNEEHLNVEGQEQLLIDGNQVNVISLQGNLSKQSHRTTSIDVREFSTSSNTVLVESREGNPLTLTIPTENPGHWNETVSATIDDNHDVESNEDSVTITFDPDDGPYEFQLSEVGIGDATQDAAADRAMYSTTVYQDGSVQVKEFRDKFNNPVTHAEISEIPWIDRFVAELDTVDSVDDLPETTGSTGRIEIPRNERFTDPGQGETFSWVKETTGGTVEIDLDDVPVNDETNLSVTATTVWDDEDDVATTTEIESVDSDRITVRSWRILTPALGWFDGADLEPVPDGTEVHVIASVPADEVVDPANFRVEIDSTNSPVDAGDDLVVQSTIENTGDETATQTIELVDFDGNVVDDEEITLESGASTTETLRWETEAGDGGIDDVIVRSSDDSQTVQVMVEETGVVESINSVGLSSGGGNVIDVTVDVTSENENNELIIRSLGPDGSERDSVSGSAESGTFAVDGANQATEVEVILQDVGGNQIDSVLEPWDG